MSLLDGNGNLLSYANFTLNFFKISKQSSVHPKMEHKRVNLSILFVGKNLVFLEVENHCLFFFPARDSL